MTMMVCYELGKTEEEVGTWGIEDLVRWVAFFRLKRKAEMKAIENAKNRSAHNSNSNVTTY